MARLDYVYQDKILQNEIYEILVAQKHIIKELESRSWYDWQDCFRRELIRDVIKRTSEQIERRIYQAEKRWRKKGRE